MKLKDYIKQFYTEGFATTFYQKPTKFISKKKRVYVYSSNSSYNLSFNDFSELFKDSKFIIEDFEDSTIDPEKDKEYYSFKHK